MSCSKTAFGEQLEWWFNFFSYPLRLFNSIESSKSLAHRSVNSSVPPNSFKELGLLALTTPFAIFRVCLLLVTPPAAVGSMAISFTFFYHVTVQKVRCRSFLKHAITGFIFKFDFQN